MTDKICSRCKTSKKINRFYKNNYNKDGLQNYCKDCHRIWSRLNERNIRKTNPEKLRERAKKFYDKNPYKYKEYNKTERQRVRNKVINGYGGKCSCCGESEYMFLALDHVNGGGNYIRKKSRNNLKCYRDAINRDFPSDYQLLCHNCNCAKGFYGFCPHNKK